jgi:hypothetical protein
MNSRWATMSLIFSAQTLIDRHLLFLTSLGLKQNEQCIYIAEDNSIPRIYRELENIGVDVDVAQKRDALRIVTKHETYLRHGIFEPEKMVGDLNNEVKYSMEHGFAGLRASGEMSWALDLPSAVSFENALSLSTFTHR